MRAVHGGGRPQPAAGGRSLRAGLDIPRSVATRCASCASASAAEVHGRSPMSDSGSGCTRAADFHYERVPPATYFDLCLYRSTRRAVEGRLPALHFGLGSHDVKLIRGARLEPLWSVLIGPDRARAGVGDGAQLRTLQSWRRWVKDFPGALPEQL